MATIRIRKAFRNSSGYVSGLSPTAALVNEAGTPVSEPIPLSEVDTTGVYIADITTTEPLIAVVDGGAALTDPDDRYDRILVHPSAESLTILEAPSGTYGITIITKDADDNRIPAVRVYVRNNSGQIIRTLTTDANGEVTALLENGAYTAEPYKPMVNIESVSFIVDGASDTVEITGAIVEPTTPVDGTQTIHFIPSDPALVLDTSVNVWAEVVETNAYVSSAIISKKKLAATRLATHYEINLAKGQTFWIVGTSAGVEFLRKRITVTNDDTRSLADYL